jgi:hypothetical protein
MCALRSVLDQNEYVSRSTLCICSELSQPLRTFSLTLCTTHHQRFGLYADSASQHRNGRTCRQAGGIDKDERWWTGWHDTTIRTKVREQRKEAIDALHQLWRWQPQRHRQPALGSLRLERLHQPRLQPQQAFASTVLASHQRCVRSRAQSRFAFLFT